MCLAPLKPSIRSRQKDGSRQPEEDEKVFGKKWMADCFFPVFVRFLFGFCLVILVFFLVGFVMFLVFFYWFF